MNFERLMGSTFYKEVGLVVTLASVMTLVITQIIKIFLLKKSKYQIMSESKKDEKLSKLGRFVALVCYSVFYIGVEVYLHHRIIVDGALLVSLISGASLTLATAKGIYTSLHQKRKSEEQEIQNKQKLVIGKQKGE